MKPFIFALAVFALFTTAYAVTGNSTDTGVVYHDTNPLVTNK